MTPRPLEPFANFERARRDMDELFGDVLERTGLAAGRGFSPRVDVYHCGDPPHAVVKAELAGVDIETVAIEVRDRQLMIAGERRAREPEGRRYQQVEIQHGPFRRVVELGAEVVADEARATYEDGVLRVEVPLAEAARGARHVPIAGHAGGEVADRAGDPAAGAGGGPERAA